MESLRDQLSAAAATPSVSIESKLASVCKEFSFTNDTIGKLRAEVKAGHDQTDYNLRRSSDQQSRAI